MEINLSNFAAQNTDDLQNKVCKLKKEKIINVVIIGFLIGVVLYSVIAKGIGLGGFLALGLAFYFIRGTRKSDLLYKKIDQELKSRQTA